jgi:hypothetical protein
MNREKLLAETLHATLDRARPSADLEARIVQRLSTAGRRTARFNLRFGLAAAGVLVLALALVPLALNMRSNGGPGAAGSPGSGPSAAPDQLAHFDREGLAFDYPATWKDSVSGLNMHYVTILEYLGTGSGLATCQAITPGPNDNFISGTECGSNVNVGPGQVMVTLSKQDGPPMGGPIDPSDPSHLPSGGKYVTVGGLPAVFGGDAAGSGASGSSGAGSSATETLGWTLSVPEQINSRLIISAQFQGPGADQLRAQVEALVASIRYDPPVPVLNPADGPRIAAIGVAQAAANDPSFACFPKVPGTKLSSIVTQFPMYSPLRKPLSVMCETAIQPYAFGLWKMTLTESWTAASDRSAGSLTTTVWLSPDGTPGETGGGPAPSEIPYWP